MTFSQNLTYKILKIFGQLATLNGMNKTIKTNKILPKNSMKLVILNTRFTTIVS